MVSWVIESHTGVINGGKNSQMIPLLSRGAQVVTFLLHSDLGARAWYHLNSPFRYQTLTHKKRDSNIRIPYLKVVK